MVDRGEREMRRTMVEARRDELLTVGELALLTKCCEKTIYRRIWAGRQAGAYKIGGQWRIDLAQAMVPAAAVQSCTVAAREQVLQTKDMKPMCTPDRKLSPAWRTS